MQLVTYILVYDGCGNGASDGGKKLLLINYLRTSRRAAQQIFQDPPSRQKTSQHGQRNHSIYMILWDLNQNFPKIFLSLLTTPTDEPCLPEMRSKIFFLQIEITQTKLRTNFRSNCSFFDNPFGLKMVLLDFSFRTPSIFYGTQNFSFRFNF